MAGLWASVRCTNSWRALLYTMLAGYVGGLTIYLCTTPIYLIAATVVGYAGWALGYLGRDVAVPLLMLSLLPFLFGLVRSGTRPARAATGVIRQHDAVVLAAWTLGGVTAAGALYLA